MNVLILVFLSLVLSACSHKEEKAKKDKSALGDILMTLLGSKHEDEYKGYNGKYGGYEVEEDVYAGSYYPGYGGYNQGYGGNNNGYGGYGHSVHHSGYGLGNYGHGSHSSYKPYKPNQGGYGYKRPKPIGFIVLFPEDMKYEHGKY